MSFDPNALGGMMAGLQQQMATMKADAARKEVVGKAGGSMVQVTANGALEILSVRIDPSLSAATADDREMLEDLITVATNDALRQAQALMASGVQGMLGGLPLPPGLL